MKVKVYFSKEPDIAIILKKYKISRQALTTIYELVWECEFKNIVNAGRVWLKFKEEEKPFGISMKQTRSHYRISPGDLIQITNEFYLVEQVGTRKIELVD